MERWSSRVAVVTGASSGIGAAITELLVKEGMQVVGLARRVERIQALSDRLNDAPGKLYALKTDVSKEEDILEAFRWVKDNLGGVDVMVNNAGVSPFNNLTDGKTSDWRQLSEVNILGLSICTREAIQSMKERGVDDGHIIHINSVAGHNICNLPGFFMYTATKHAVTVLTEGLRKELAQQRSNIRVTSISPGIVDTEIIRKDELMELMPNMPMLQPEDIANAVMFVLSTPKRVQVNEITIRPTGEML